MKEISIFIQSMNKNLIYRIGKNAQNNFDLIDMSDPDDIWFHINNKASEHVVLSVPNEISFTKKQMKDAITQGALLCKIHSKYKSNSNVEIVYTEIKNIKKTSVVGSVTIKNSKIKII